MNHDDGHYAWVVTYYNKQTGEIGSRGFFLQESEAIADMVLAMKELGDDYIFNIDQLTRDYVTNLVQFVPS